MFDFEDALERAGKLESKLRVLVPATHGLDKSSIPPVWSGSINDLERFAVALQAYVDNPKLDRAKRTAEQLSGMAGPAAARPHLTNEFLIANFGLLEGALAAISMIVNHELRQKAANEVLTVVATRPSAQGIEACVQDIGAYCEVLADLKRDVLEKAQTTPLLEAVRTDLSSKLFAPQSFDTAQVPKAKTEWTQAENADRLANTLGIKGDVLAQYYRDKGSTTEPLAATLEGIRTLMNKILPFAQAPEGLGTPPIDFGKARSEALQSENLEDVRTSLQRIADQGARWLEEQVRRADLGIRKIESISRYVQLSQGLLEALSRARSSITQPPEHSNPSSIFQARLDVQGLEKTVAQESAAQYQLTELQREILSNPDDTARIRVGDADAFWTELRRVVDSGLADIRLVKKAVGANGTE